MRGRAKASKSALSRFSKPRRLLLEKLATAPLFRFSGDEPLAFGWRHGHRC